MKFTRKGFLGFGGALLAIECLAATTAQGGVYQRGIPLVDISADAARQVVIAEGTKDRYEGHPTTLLADDGKTMFCVWTTGHGGPCGQMARSDDGGKTWTRLDATLPEVYRKTHRNCPTLQKIKGPDGKTRYFIFSSKVEDNAKVKDGENVRKSLGLAILVSEDGGKTWRDSPYQPQLWSAMPPTGFMALKDGTCALFGQRPHVAEGFKDGGTQDQDVWMSISKDGGFTWSEMRTVASCAKRNLCEPCCLRSPDGKSLALVIRENRHKGRSMMCFSDDEGKTWTTPVDTPAGLTGDRHEAIVLPDGRLLVAFRNQAVGDPLRGQYLAWVGTWDDLRNCKPGQCQIRLLNHHGRDGWPGNWMDTGYSGVELLPDGTVVCTTYSRHFADGRQSSVVSTRFKMSEVVGVYDNAHLLGTTDKDPLAYKVGEDIVFTLKLVGLDSEGAKALTNETVTLTRTGDDGKKENVRLTIGADRPLVYRTKLDRPGCVEVHARLLSRTGGVARRREPASHWDAAFYQVGFDGGALVAPDKLPRPSEPKDFDAFWAERKARLAKVPMKAERREVACANKAVTLYAVSVTCAGDYPVTGYLSVPKDASRKYPATVAYHGYSFFKHLAPQEVPSDRIRFEINAHGQLLPAFGGTEETFRAHEKKANGKRQYAFNDEENRNPDTAYFMGMAYRVLRSLEYVKSLPEWDGKNLRATGGSQGGLQTSWATGLDPDVTESWPEVTWCCDMEGRKLGRCQGDWYFNYQPALAYFDAVNFAKRYPKDCKLVIVRAGMGDSCCTPTGLAMLYLDAACRDKQITFTQGSTHGYIPIQREDHVWKSAGAAQPSTGRTR